MDALETEKKKEPSKSRKQIQDSRARLIKLEKDGFELVRKKTNLEKIFKHLDLIIVLFVKVTNVRVAGDSREHARRVEEEELLRSRKEKLEQEAKSSNEKFEEIVKKWETANTKWIPQELYEVKTISIFLYSAKKAFFMHNLRFNLASDGSKTTVRLDGRREE